MRLPTWLAQHLAALRALLVLTVLLGLAYPLLLTAAGRIPGLGPRTAGSLVTGPAGTVVGSRLLGQSFTDAQGRPVARYFQSRPSAAGSGYDPTSTGASNLGPEDVVDSADRTSLLTQVCARSRAVGEFEGVDGRRPYCTAEGVGAVLAVYRRDGLTGPVTRAVSVNQVAPAVPFLAEYAGVPVQPAQPGVDHVAGGGLVTPVRGDAPAVPAVPADAVTAGGSGLDPHISVAYAVLQAPRVARERRVPEARIRALITRHTDGRVLGFLGEPVVNVLLLNVDLDGETG